MQTYTSYKPSNIEWIGEIPSHWRILRMKFLCQITTGNKDTKDRKDEGEYPFYVRSQTVERIDSYSFEGEGILTAGDGVGVGKVYHHVNGKFAFHQRVYLLYNFNNVLGKYLFEYFKNNFSITVEDQNAKSTVDSLRLNMLQDFPVAIPSISEQQAIVNYLDHKTALIDELIIKKERKIELLKEQRSALINHVVTKGLNPDAPMKDSGIDWIGEIPEHWEVTKLKFVLKKDGLIRGPFGSSLKSESFIENGNYKIYEQKNAIYDNLLLGEHFIDEEKFNDLQRFRILKNDILMSCSGTIGKTTLVGDNFQNGIINQALLIIRLSDKIDKFFFLHSFKSQYLELQVIDNSAGGAMKNIVGMDIFKGITIYLPPLTEQQLIAEYLDNQTTIIDKSIEIETQKIEKLKEYRQSLISNVVTGKICVTA